MQQFVVPQFIDVEDKIIGPITVRQFIILLVAAGLMFIEYKLADFTLFLLVGILTLLVAGIIAFVKINGQPMHHFLLNFLQTARTPKLHVWNKRLSDQELKGFLAEVEEEAPEPVARKPRVGSSRLAELALIVDTGGVYQGEQVAAPAPGAARR